MEKVNIMLGMFVGVLLILSVLIIFTNIANSEDLTSLNTKEHITIIKEDTPDFLKEDFNSEYGVIEISKSDSTKLADYSLTKIDESIINVIVYGKAILYSDGKLFDDKKFKDIKNNLIELDYSQYYIYKNVSYVDQEVATYKEICSTPITEKGNITSEKEVCYSVPNTYKNVTKSKMEWIEYDYEILKSGNYEWKMEARRPINKQVDFIPVAQEKELTEWVWWNNAWNSKKEIKVKENSGSALSNYTTLFYIPYDSDMQADFDDLRFVDSAETTELGYWIENKTDSNFAWVWVKIPTLTESVNSTIYLYYGNSGANSNSNMGNAFLLGDDFDDNSINTSLWNTYTGGGGTKSITESGGVLTLSVGGSGGPETLVTSKTLFGLGHIIKAQLKMDSQSYNYPSVGWIDNSTGGGTRKGTYVWNHESSYKRTNWDSSDNSQTYSSNADYHTYEIKSISTSDTRYFYDGISVENKTSQSPSSARNYGFYNVNHPSFSPTGTSLIINWVYVRHYASLEPTYYIVTACTFSGYVKDSAGGGLDEAEVVIFNQNNKNEIYNTTTDENGYWSKNVTNSTSNFVAVAYYNNTLVGSAKPFILGTC